jgi:hypothetical protein
MKLNAEQYRKFPAYSNSDLTELKNQIFGIKNKKPVNAFATGTALHEIVLEKNFVEREGVDYNKIYKMAESLSKDSYFSWLKQFGAKEQNVFHTHEETGLKLKSRCDIVHAKNIVTDLKTTSEKTFQDFLDACIKYEYDRQMAFYHDVLTAEHNAGSYKIVIVAVQKQSPFDVFIYEPSNEFIDYGRKKYRKLLLEAKKRNFRPTSWGWDSFKDYQLEKQATVDTELLVA